MKRFLVAASLLCLALTAVPHGTIRARAENEPAPASQGVLTQNLLEGMQGLGAMTHFERSDLPLGANMLSITRSIASVSLRLPGSDLLPVHTLSSGRRAPGFFQKPSPAALALLVVALLLLPFMGRTEFH